MLKIKKWIRLAMLLTVIVTLVGCGSKPAETDSGDVTEAPQTETPEEVETETETEGEEIVINYPTFQVGVNSGAPVLKEDVRLFNEQYKGKIRVEIEEIPGDQAYLDKMKILLAADELPDLVYGGNVNLLPLALENDSVVDLTPYLEADPEWKDSFLQEDLDYNGKDGKYYGVVPDTAVTGFYYNKELFEEAGIDAPAETWDEFMEQCETLKQAGITPLSMDTADSGWLTGLWLGAMVGTNGQTGNDFMNTKYPTEFNIPEFTKGLTMIEKILKDYTTSDAIGGKYENGANNFYSGQTAMVSNGPQMIPDFSDPDKAPAGFEEKVGVAIFPEKGIYEAPKYGYFICSKDKEKADATVEFLKFITNKDAQLRALNMIGRLPASPSIELTEDVRANHPILSELIDKSSEAEYKFSTYQSLWYPNVTDTYSLHLPSLAMGDMTIEEFITELEETAAKN